MKNFIVKLNCNEVNAVSGGGLLQDGIVLAITVVGPFVGLAVGVFVFFALTTAEKASVK